MDEQDENLGEQNEFGEHSVLYREEDSAEEEKKALEINSVSVSRTTSQPPSARYAWLFVRPLSALGCFYKTFHQSACIDWNAKGEKETQTNTPVLGSKMHRMCERLRRW